MKKLLRKAVVCGGAVCAVAGSALAEGTATGGEVTSALVTSYIDSGKGEIVAVLTAGAAIVGAFFVWGLIKRALRASK